MISAARFFAPAYCCRALRSGRCLRRPPGAEACGVGGQERERPLLVVPVLGQVEADPSHLPPARRPRAQQAGHAARGRGGVLHPRVELLPQAPQEVRREILASLHRRSVQDPGGQERVARRLDRHLPGVRRQVAEPGQVVFRKLLPVAQAADLLGRQLLRRQGEKRAAPIAPKGVQHGTQSGRGFLRCGIRFPAQMTGRRQSHGHVTLTKASWKVVTRPISASNCQTLHERPSRSATCPGRSARSSPQSPGAL